MLNAFRDEIFKLAKNDKRVIVICTDQEIGLEKFADEIPNQYFMEGISEANIAGMAAGLAMRGFIPYIVNHASFLTRRSYEQIVLDVCLQNLPVRFVGMGSGLATAHLGPTHTTIEDISIMRSIPGMTVICPCDADEVTRLTTQSIDWPAPIYMRLAKYGKPKISKDLDQTPIGKATLVKGIKGQSSELLIVATGYMLNTAIEVHEALAKQKISSAVLNFHSEMLLREAKNVARIVTLEEHSTIGGLGTTCIDALVENWTQDRFPKILKIGLEDKFVHNYGAQSDLLFRFGLDTESVLKKIIAHSS
jgi:transketolase